MIVSDLVVEVRDANLQRVAQLSEADLATLTVVARANAVGGWEVTLPHTVLDPATGRMVAYKPATELRKEGAGLIVTGPYGVILSGPMTSAVYEATDADAVGNWTLTGASDLLILHDGQAYPQPSNGDPTTQTVANDKRTNSAENLIRQYVAYNVTPQAPGIRQVGFRSRMKLESNNTNLGPILTFAPRFDNLLELCQRIAQQGDLLFDIVQADTFLELRIKAPRDRAKNIRMAVDNDLLSRITYGYSAPTTTYPIVAGQGEGTYRRIIAQTSADSITAETRWKRRIERFVDQRNTNVTSELQQAGNEALTAGAAAATGLQASPTDAETMLYGRDWTVGDIVSVVIEGQEVSNRVTEVAIGVTGSAVTFVATLGDPGAFDTEAASQSRAATTASRVEALERNTEVPSRGVGTVSVTTPPSGFPEGDTYGYCGSGFPTAYGTVKTTYVNIDRAVQVVYEKDGVGRREWYRTSAADVWGPWSTVSTEGHTHTAADLPGRVTRSITATSGWTLAGGHPSGVLQGSPHVSAMGGHASAVVVVSNSSGSTTTVGGGMSVATGLPRSATGTYFPLSVNGAVASQPGPVLPDLSAFVNGSGVLTIRGGRAIAAGEIFTISGVYPTLD